MKTPFKSPMLVMLAVIVAGWTVYQQVIQPLTINNQSSPAPLEHINLPIHNNTTTATRYTWKPNPESRNPFTRPTKPVQTNQHVAALVYKVSAILYDAKKPLALINGKLVEVGEYIGSYQVTHINNHSVSLQRGTQTKQLHFR